MMKKIFTFFAALACVMSMSAETTRLYCKMAQDWWKADGAAVGAYYWGTGAAPQWPGNRMIPVKGETDLWYVDIDATQYQNIIFTRVNGSGTVSDWGAKTADLVVPTDGKNLYTITSTSPVWGGSGVTGEWSVYTATGNENPEPEPEPEPGTGEPTPETGITYNVTVPAGTNACYIAGEMNTWTHQEMTKVDDTHYTLTIAEATTTMKYKYCSGPGWAYVEKTATGDEVADRTHTENDVVEAWAAVYDPNNVPSQGETKDITVKAKVPATWTDQITAWVWATGGEGTEVVPAQEGEWYVYTQNCAELNIIFKNGAGWKGDANQTVDITGITESTCIEITADGVTKATYTEVDCEGGAVDPTPGETKTIYLNTGGAQLWNQADAKFFVHAWGGAADLDAQMTLVAGDIYQVEIAHTFIIFLRLAPAATGVVWEGENLWNKTADLEIPEGMNCYTITGWEPDAGTWSSYTPVDGPTTDNEQVVINKKATKIVYNGQICIIRDGVMFNILGQVIK